MTEEEYLRRLGEIQESLAKGVSCGEPVEMLEARHAALEFDLAIDYRLGGDFPENRRQDLRAVRDRFEDGRKVLAAQLSQGLLGQQVFLREIQRLLDAMAVGYSEILAPKEYDAFVGPTTGIISDDAADW